MATLFIKIEHTPDGGTTTDITQNVRFDSVRGLDLKSGKADLLVKNSQYRNKKGGVSVFQEDSLIEIYADYSPITKANSQLLLSGRIRKISPSFGENGGQIKLTVADRTVLLLGSLWSKEYPANGSDPNKTASLVVRDLILQNSKEITVNNVATSTSSGGVFPDIPKYGRTFKPVVEQIQELSQPGYTGEDRAYLFYVDKDNDLHWFYPSQTSNGTIIEGTDTIYSARADRNADELINMIIFNAGQDLNGNGTLDYYYNRGSKSNQLRMKYQPMIDISTGPNGFFSQEIAAGNLVKSTSGTVPYQGMLYVAATSGTTSWGETFSTFDEYNTLFRNKLKAEGENRAIAITTAFGDLLWSVDFTLRGTSSYTAGDLLTITSPTLGLASELLRVQDVQHNFGEDGWKTVVMLKEDFNAIAGATLPGA